VTGTGCKAQSVADKEGSNVFCGTIMRSGWVCYDFKDRRVAPTHYSLRTCTAHGQHCFPTSWVIEVSEDGQRWEVIDRKSEGSSMNLNDFTKTFAVDTPQSGQMVRFRQTGPCNTAGYCMDLTSFELFGTLI
jgi:hypothetical protein